MRILVACLLLAFPQIANANCRQALALGLDVSGSVDGIEYRLQMDGLAAALMRDEVQKAILEFPAAPIRLYVYEWAGPGSVRRVLDWRELSDSTAVSDVADTLRGTGRVQQDPATALGQAMVHGATALMTQSECWRFTLDLSGDGESNSGPRPRSLHQNPVFSRITVNGLAVETRQAAPRHGEQSGDLSSYFKNEVIRGPGAFVETAKGFADFEQAMALKLLKELASIAVSHVGETQRTTR